MDNFIKNLLVELSLNGKSLVAWIINEVPGITGYPGLMQALQDFAANQNWNTGANLFFQVLFAGASGHRLIKVLADAVNKTAKNSSF